MKRLITGLLVAGGWLALLFFGSFSFFWLAIVLIGCLALHEYTTVVLGPDASVAWLVGTLCGAVPLVAAVSSRGEVVAAALPLSLLVLVVFVVLSYQHLASPLAVLTRLGFGILYVGFCAAHLILLRGEPDGVKWLLLLTAITVASDSFAYYSGRLLGKRKLCPAVSPGKTVAGFIGGLAGGILVAVVLAAYLFDHPRLPMLAVVAALLSCVGVMGDLCESVLKRSMGVKDSGAILPGHGGVLDRIDSLLLTAPLLYNLVHFGSLVA